VFFFYSHAWRDDRDNVYGGGVHIFGSMYQLSANAMMYLFNGPPSE
jgi:hypothetical protein